MSWYVAILVLPLAVGALFVTLPLFLIDHAIVAAAFLVVSILLLLAALR